MTDNPTISDAARQAAEAIAPHVTANDPAEQHMADTMREFIVHSIASLIARHCRVAEKDAALVAVDKFMIGMYGERELTIRRMVAAALHPIPAALGEAE